MPYDQNDDTIIRGPLKTWLKYKVWGVPGYVLVLVALVAGALIQTAFSHLK